jgi:alpha-glucosidase
VPLLVFSNHDNPRTTNRFGDGKHDGEIARLIATILLTPRDAALMYYGEELGMVNNDPKSKDQVKDPIGKLGWPKEKGRDGERTPMQWNSDNNSGFTSGKTPWLGVAPDYKTVNVSSERRDPNSMLNYYKRLIHLRKENPQMRNGDFVTIDNANESVLSYLRKTADGKAVLVSMNFTAASQTVKLDLVSEGVKGAHSKLLLASYPNANGLAALGDLTLPPFGSYIGEIVP